MCLLRSLWANSVVFGPIWVTCDLLRPFLVLRYPPFSVMIVMEVSDFPSKFRVWIFVSDFRCLKVTLSLN